MRAQGRGFEALSGHLVRAGSGEEAEEEGLCGFALSPTSLFLFRHKAEIKIISALPGNRQGCLGDI